MAEALQDAMSNPSNIFKYMKNPKIMNIINKLSSKVGTGGFPGFQAPPGEEPKSNPTAPTDNMGLD